MLSKATELRGITIAATDGPIGETEEFYFDDQAWVVIALRYARRHLSSTSTGH